MSTFLPAQAKAITMDDIYDNLENYDEVDLVNELRSENSDLKNKLVECTTSMEILQKDFDNLSAEFKKLEMNYSSLLKIARAEIKRKTDMITNLNIEKDMLVIKTSQSVPPSEKQNIVASNIGSETKRKKKKKRNKKGGQKEKDEVNREDSIHPSETSSTATDNTQNILSKERVRNSTKGNEILKHEACPNRRGDNCTPSAGPIVDRRVSELSRPPLAKFASDEEFEDMYSALGPKTPPPRELERGRKRGRDQSQDARTYNASVPQDKVSDYPEHFAERYVRNKAYRYSAGDRNIMNRDKEYNECDRNISRDPQYNESDRNANRGYYQRKRSTERHRRNAREFEDDRYLHQYDKHRRLDSPPREPRERLRHRSRELRPHYDRERDDHKPVAHRYDNTTTRKHRIHGEYDEPQSKKPRVELHPNHQDDRWQCEKQFSKEGHPVDVRDRTCQSPDFSHTENESSNEPVITTTDSIEVPTDECPNDPRVTSNKYVKTMDGTKEFLHTVNVREVDLQPVNKSLWNLEDIEVPLALKRKPVEISEELVEEMDTHRPLSMESGEVGSETTDTEVDGGVNQNRKRISSKDYFINEKTKVMKCPPNKSHKNVELKSEVVHIESRQKLQKESKDFTAHNDPTTASQSSNESSDHREVDDVDDCLRSNLKIEKRKDAISPHETSKIDHETDVEKLETKSAKHKISTPEESTNFRDDKYSTVSKKGFSDNRDVGKVIATSYRCVSSKKDSKIEISKDKKSAIEKNLKDTEQKDDVQTKPKPIRQGKSEEAAIAGDGLAMSFKESSNNPEVDEGIGSNHKGVSIKNDSKKVGRRKDKKSPVEKTSKVIEHESDIIVQTDLNSTRHKLPKSEDDNITRLKNAEKPCILQKLLDSVLDKSEKVDSRKTEKLATKSSQDNKKVELDVHCDNTEKSSIQKIIRSVSDMQKGPKSVDTVKSKRADPIEPKNVSNLTTINNTEKETESNVSIFREFEHRVYSTRNIVEGDLELSDDTNDEAIDKADKKVQEKKKVKSKKKSHRDTSNEKTVDTEDVPRRSTRPKKEKEKEVKSQNKFSELFGDSSSLITPEELNLATKEAHALPADCCPPLCEDAQDTIIQIPHISETEETSSGSVKIDDRLKGGKNDTHHKTHSDLEEVSVSNECQKVNSTHSQLVSDIKQALSNEKVNEMQNTKLTSDKIKNDSLRSHENLKEIAKSNKNPKSKHEKKLSTSECTEESNIKKGYSLGTSLNTALVVGDNKENTNCNDNSDKNISSEMAKIFETVSSKNISIESDKVNEEKIQLNESVIEAIAKNTAQDIPNLAPVIDEPGLVKTVVISTGNQHTDSNTVQYIKPLNALASSTPAKEIPVMNISETESKIKQTACVNVTIASEDSVSQSETDAPDVRINFYKRRRKVKK